ncbi:hypothetical protein PV327_003730 [Microctonus hyperodae]|uniref:Cytochrome c oxidase subunit 6C n=1 Tax=Microctonus hyperodae TaxID=165561 RepID=A0AA39G4Z1_MICHY|nr:hypothetical protein PV327_003730 [Microctonus hyperodae]
MTKLIQKPQMRNLWTKQMKLQLLGGVVACFLVGYSIKIFYSDPRKRAYDDFYRTYDNAKQEKIMEDAGLLQSCPK